MNFGKYSLTRNPILQTKFKTLLKRNYVITLKLVGKILEDL